MVDLSQLQRQLSSLQQVSKELHKDLDKVGKVVQDLEEKLQPVIAMNQTVGLCKSNLTQSVELIKVTVDALTQSEECIKVLKRKETLNNEPALFAHSLKTASQILQSNKLDHYMLKSEVVAQL